MHAVQTICGLQTLLYQMRRPDERVCLRVGWRSQPQRSSFPHCQSAFVCLPSICPPVWVYPQSIGTLLFWASGRQDCREVKAENHRRSMLHNRSFTGQSCLCSAQNKSASEDLCHQSRVHFSQGRWQALVWQAHKRGIHFLAGSFHRGAASTRGKQSTTECEPQMAGKKERIVKALSVFFSLTGPKCSVERRFLETMTSKWNRYRWDFYSSRMVL